MAAKYYSTPLVKVGNSSSIFTSNIYLSDASNVGSYGLELVVSGEPSNVSYSYTAANVAGFSVLAYAGIAANYSASFDVGGVFASTGVLIGSVSVTFATAPLALPKLVVLDTNLNLEDIAGVPIAVSYTEVVSNALSGATVDIQAYSWKAHTLLNGVTVGLGNVSQVTGASGDAGSVSFTGVTDTAITLSATRTVPTAEAVATSAAVNLQDAIAILKMIVGLDVNGTGKALSPYQALAADYDGNGVVQLSDAIGVLKHVVGLSAPDPTWHFVNEIDSTVPAKANLAPGVAPTNIAAALSGSSPVHVGLVGYLSGDVDGSFAGATGATALNTSYFTSLVAAHTELGSSFNLAQFGVY